MKYNGRRATELSPEKARGAVKLPRRMIVRYSICNYPTLPALVWKTRQPTRRAILTDVHIFVNT